MGSITTTLLRQHWSTISNSPRAIDEGWNADIAFDCLLWIYDQTEGKPASTDRIQALIANYPSPR